MRILKLVLVYFLFIVVNFAGDKFLVKIKKDKRIEFTKTAGEITTNNEKLKSLIKVNSLRKAQRLNLRYLFQDCEIYELDFEKRQQKKNSMT